jgi:dynein heavy chain 2
MKSNQPEKDMPAQIQQKLTPFNKLILIQVFRPDRLESAMHNFVKEAFGNQTIQAATFSLANLYQTESSPTDPILFIISAGSDPSAELEEFADQIVGRNAFHEIAMGGGQNDIAIETIK